MDLFEEKVHLTTSCLTHQLRCLPAQAASPIIRQAEKTFCESTQLCRPHPFCASLFEGKQLSDSGGLKLLGSAKNEAPSTCMSEDVAGLAFSTGHVRAWHRAFAIAWPKSAWGCSEQRRHILKKKNKTGLLPVVNENWFGLSDVRRSVWIHIALSLWPILAHPLVLPQDQCWEATWVCRSQALWMNKNKMFDGTPS